LDLAVVAPAANVTGAYWQGAITIGQIPDAGLSVQDLQALSHESGSARTHHTMRGAIMNNNIVYDQLRQVQTGAITYEQASLEVVSFLILEKSAVNITTGANMNYSITVAAKGNFAFWPKATDSFAAGLHPVRNLSSSNSKLRDHVYDPTSSIGDQVFRSVEHGIRSLLESTPGQWAMRAMPYVAQVASLLAEDQNADPGTECVLVSENAHSLREALRALERFSPRDSEYSSFFRTLDLFRQWQIDYLAIDSRLTPLHDVAQEEVVMTKKKP